MQQSSVPPGSPADTPTPDAGLDSPETGAADAGFLDPRVAAMVTGLDASPTPYHAVEAVARRLDGAGFVAARHDRPFPAGAGPRYVRRGGALVAWVQPEGPIEGFTLVGAHTDSPNLRIKSRAQMSSAGWAQLGVEVYGGVLLNSWLDRDLSLAGRVVIREGNELISRLVRDDQPILRIPQLAIHLDREIRERGLLLNPQQHTNPLWALGCDESGTYEQYLAGLAGVETGAIVASEIMAYDTQSAAIVGRDRDLISSARIDNLFSCFAATDALIAVTGAAADGAVSLRRVPVMVLYDHEEIGSQTANGAVGRFLVSLLERVAAVSGGDRIGFLEQLGRSLVVSADGAHATNPNYADRHEPEHHIAVNQGVVVKRNANQRYATDADSEWFIRAICADLSLPLQTFHVRDDMPCGSTIGPITAAGLAVPTVDIGAPQLAMHSIREMAGTADVNYLIETLAGAWRSDLALPTT